MTWQLFKKILFNENGWVLPVMAGLSLAMGGYGMYEQRRLRKKQEREMAGYQKYGQKAMDKLMTMMEEGPGEYSQSDWFRAQQKGIDAQLRKKGVSQSGLASAHMMNLGGADYDRHLQQWYNRMMPYWNIAQGAGLGTAGMSGSNQSLINQMTMATSGLSNASYFMNLNQPPQPMVMYSPPTAGMRDAGYGGFNPNWMNQNTTNLPYNPTGPQ